MGRKSNYTSEFGHLVRITALFSRMEDAVGSWPPFDPRSFGFEFDPFLFVRAAIADDDGRFVLALQEAKTALKVLSPHVPHTNRHSRTITQAWEESLPEHLQYTNDNLHTMNCMYETPANAGAWCFFYMHALHSCCEMSAATVCSLIVPPAVLLCSVLTDCCLRNSIPFRRCTIGAVLILKGLYRGRPPMPGTVVCEYSNLLVRG